MNYYKTLILCLLLWAGTLPSHAVPARGGWITVTQSDGSQLRIRIFGDEYYHYAESEDGYTLVGNGKGDYCYALLDAEGNLKSSGIRARSGRSFSLKEQSLLGKGFKKGIRPVNRSLEKRKKMQELAAESVPYPLRTRAASRSSISAPDLMSRTLFPSKGHQKALVLLVEFPDVPFTEGTRERFDNLLNGKNYTSDGANGSAWQYYYDNSNGLFDPEFIVLGPYKLAHPRSYYTANDDAKASEMIIEGCQQADSETDFSQYAANGEAYGIFAFYSGGGESDGSDPDGVWPHSSSVYGNVVLDGVRLGTYACTSELRTRNWSSVGLAAIGTFCHEFGHMMGWPDLYDTDYEANGQADGLGNYSLMASGSYNNDGNTPPTLGILERWMMGWAEPQIIESSGNYRLLPAYDGKGFLIPTPVANDYFLLEYRGTGGTVWDMPQYLSASYPMSQSTESGLIVYHIDYTASSLWTYMNMVNAYSAHERAKVVCSQPAKNAILIPAMTFFPGRGNVTKLTGTSNANFNSWKKSAPQLGISSIQLEDGAVMLTTNGIADLKATTYQYDVLLSWSDASSSKWTIRWKYPTENTWLGEAESMEESFHMSGLIDGKNYQVSVINDEGVEQTIAFMTQKKTSSYPHLEVVQSEGGSKKTLFALADFGEVKQVVWNVDGKETSNYEKLTPGKHRVTAEITRADGTKEYIMHTYKPNDKDHYESYTPLPDTYPVLHSPAHDVCQRRPLSLR